MKNSARGVPEPFNAQARKQIGILPCLPTLPSPPIAQTAAAFPSGSLRAESDKPF
ncbi:MAG: hypothetical protein WAU17_05865 [Nitrospirales bacterium]